jgi:hypothetical protein
LSGLGWLILALAVVDWLALRTRTLSHPPWVLAILVTVAAALLAWRTGQVVVRMARRRGGRIAAAAELGLLAGVLIALVGGMTNWLLGLQGFVILVEGDSVPLHGAAHLQGFEAGPLARLEEMGLVLALDEVELVPTGANELYPHSHLRFWRRDGEPVRLHVAPLESDSSGSLRFFQGAFGFAPRIVILREETVLLDRVVPFVTERRGSSGVSFEGQFTVESDRLDLQGVIDLASLDEALRGHAVLHLEVSRDGQTLGSGSLLLGHFAEIKEGYRLGFAGLEKWSEVDVMRRNYGQVVVAGTALALAGAMLWPLARWRRW